MKHCLKLKPKILLLPVETVDIGDADTLEERYHQQRNISTEEGEKYNIAG